MALQISGIVSLHKSKSFPKLFILSCSSEWLKSLIREEMRLGAILGRRNWEISFPKAGLTLLGVTKENYRQTIRC